MDELFGGAAGLAAADQEHLSDINRRIGLEAYAAGVNKTDMREESPVKEA